MNSGETIIISDLDPVQVIFLWPLRPKIEIHVSSKTRVSQSNSSFEGNVQFAPRDTLSPSRLTMTSISGKDFGTIFNEMTIGDRECMAKAVSITCQSRKESVSSVSPYDSTTHTVNDHDIHYMDGYINENEDAETERELRQAVLKAATDTALATQNIEGADGRRKVAHLCQDQKNFIRNESTLRKVSAT